MPLLFHEHYLHFIYADRLMPPLRYAERLSPAFAIFHFIPLRVNMLRHMPPPLL